MPTLISARTRWVSNGITAQPISPSANMIIGAMMKRTRLAPVGMMVSFISSFRPSASGWKSPNGPTTLGPLRNCMAAQILRSP